MKRIIVIAPHSDDETIGAGGYLCKHRDNGDELFWVNVTNAKIEYGYSDEEVERWNRITSSVKTAYGFKKVYDLALEPSGLDRRDLSNLISNIYSIFCEVKPNVVLLPYHHDAHSDHRVVFDAVMACCKSFRTPSVEKIMCTEIISETDYADSDYGFVPNYFVDISEYIDEKIRILAIYNSEVKESPFPRNEEAIRGLAKYRGASCYAHYAEAYRVLKIIER